MSLSHSPKVVTDGLVLYLDAANQRSYPKSGTTWSDLAGDENFTLYNSPAFSNENRGIFTFGSANEYARCNVGFSTINIANGFSMRVLCRSTTTSTQIICSYSSAVGNNGIRFQKYNSNLYFTFGGVFDYDTGLALSSFCDGDWKDLVLTTNNSNATIYINGEQIHTRSVSAPSMTNVSSVDIGRYSYNNSYFYSGDIGNFSMYNKILSADEVRQNYLATRGRYK